MVKINWKIVITITTVMLCYFCGFAIIGGGLYLYSKSEPNILHCMGASALIVYGITFICAGYKSILKVKSDE